MVKVSPDESTPKQIQDICTAVLTSGVDGVVVGNTTIQRPVALLDHALETGGSAHLPPREARVLLEEEGGFSGPHLFERTVSLVKAYRQELDAQVRERSALAEQQQSQGGSKKKSVMNQNDTTKRIPIFATGGITDGRRALEVLEAGADVAQVYTALVYGGKR